ncbi:hypothetical protein FPOA_03677 [Fusarium poae]|uniref:Uncharacterized protein n=1 Tax=Fusarium poae TaxID=36050 RepID=A0A1B8ARG5_FUSPO|nr:hypothetical protein FPOA_03677 [Fusarium poae]
MIEKLNDLETLLPIVRLQVWHLDKRGQSKAVNKQLSEYLSQTTLFTDWTITPASVEGTRDQYVPIEVDLTFRATSNPDQESSNVSLRWLFQSSLSTEIESFFSQRSTKPIQMNVFPLGHETTEDIKEKFTHFHIFFSLQHDSNLAIEDFVGTDRTVLTEGLRVVGCALNTHALLVEKGVGQEVLEGKFSLTQLWSNLKKKMSNTTLSHELTTHYGNDEGKIDEYMPEIKSCLQETLTSLKLFQDLASQVQVCATVIAERDPRLSSSNEEVHLALIQANLATIAFTDYRKNMTTVLQKLERKYSNEMRSSTFLFGFALAVIVVATTVCTGGLSIGAAACGGLLGLDQGVKWNKAHNKDGAVGQLDKTIDNVADALKDVKVALAAIYCSDILKMPLQSMGIRERVKILKDLGIDMKELNPESIYDRELVRMRMERFVDAQERFKDERDTVLRDAKLKVVK